jgi:hypothetical protein
LQRVKQQNDQSGQAVGRQRKERLDKARHVYVKSAIGLPSQ